MRILHDLEFVEQTGLGVPRIVNKYGEGAFEFLDDFVKVTIPFDEEVMKLVPNVPHDDIDIIISMIRVNPDVTRDEKAKVINKSTKTVQRLINNCDRIVFVESGDKGHWEVRD